MKRSRHWLWLLLAVPIAIGLMRLRFDIEVLDLLPTSLPVVNGLKLYQQNFSNARELIITIAGADAEAAETAARALAGLLREQTNLVSSVTWQPGWLEHPAQAAELIAYLWLNQPPRVVDALSDVRRATSGHAEVTAVLTGGARTCTSPYGAHNDSRTTVESA